MVWRSSSCVLAVGRLRELQGDTVGRLRELQGGTVGRLRELRGDTVFPLCTCALRCVLSTDAGADEAAQRSVQNPSHLWE